MGKITELNKSILEAEMKKVMDMQYGKSGYKVAIFTDAKGSKYKAVFSGFAEPVNNGSFTIIGAMTRRWLPTITQEFRQRMETTGDGKTRWDSRELKTKDYRTDESFDEGKDIIHHEIKGKKGTYQVKEMTLRGGDKVIGLTFVDPEDGPMAIRFDGKMEYENKEDAIKDLKAYVKKYDK